MVGYSGVTLTEAYYSDDLVVLYQGDCLELLPSMEAGSVGMVFADPPYFRVKGDWWDRQWDNAVGFLAWLGVVADGWRRVLASNGSLYCFASPQMSARVEVELSERFHILNSLVWAKPNPFLEINRGASNAGRVSKDALRAYYPNTERVVFAEQFGQDTEAEGDYTKAEAELRRSVYEPLRAKMAHQLKRTNWTTSQINEGLGTQMAGHYFGKSQWSLPTPEHYAKMQEITGGFGTPYEELRAEYEELRAEYEELRRPFNATADTPFTDVWTFPTVQAYDGKHPCEKPQALIRHAIEMSTRPDSLPILDTFAGTGSTLLAAKSMGRRAIGFEISERYCEQAAQRLSQGVLRFGDAV